ncbi:MAG: carbohydrate kinase family protein [Microgenomates group bacterium]
MYDVITFGTATLDVFLRSSGMAIEGRDGEKDICVRYGAKIEVNEIYFDYGGGGTNSAVTFARQGLKVASVVQVGNDDNGKKILADLQKEGVDTSLIDVQSGYTDYSTILWAPDGGRTILVYRGKTRLEAEDVAWEKIDGRWAYISSLEGNLEIIENLISRFRGRSLQIVWNPGARELRQKEKLLGLLPAVKVLNLNKEEMGELLAISNEQLAIRDLLTEAEKLPCEYVVITDDRRGAYLWDKLKATWWHSGIFEDSPRFETTGAGDAFGSGFATGLIKKASPEDCLYLAAANASSVVSQVGAKKGILSVSDLSQWPRQKLKVEKMTF